MFECIAAARFGFSGLVARELRGLGFEPRSLGEEVAFRADGPGLARACLWLRTADRLQVLLGDFPADSYDALYEGVRALPWRELLPRDAALPVDARCVRAILMSPSDCQSIAKKAIVDAMGKGRLPETGPRFGVEVSLRGDRCRVLLDACGAGLHKRGYRTMAGEAPIKETLAAGILTLSRWTPDQPLMDPMCGTGTFLIEAALMARNQAPGLNRPFDAQFWPIVGRAVFDEEREAARAALRPMEAHLRGTDNDEGVLAMARQSAGKAGVGGIHFQQMDLRRAAWKEGIRGMLVTNPPYGERLLARKQIQPLYQALGQLWGELPGCSAHIFTAYPEFERYFGRKAAATRKLYNGPLLCRLYHYDADMPRPRLR